MADEADARDMREQAEALHRAGDLRAAVSCYRQALDVDPGNAALFNHMAGALANLGETAAAAEAFGQAIALDPEFPDPLIHLATLLRVDGHPTQAEPLIRRALSLDAENYSAWMERGALMMLQNRFAEAAESFERALATRSEDVDALHNLGRVAFEIGQESRAVDFYRRALAVAPRQSAVLTNLGLALRARGNFEEARAAFEQALTIEPGQAAALSGVLGLLELDGRYQQALALADEALTRHDEPLLQLGAARMERRLKRPRDALRRLESLAENQSLDESLVMQLEFVRGELFDDLGEYADAWASFSRANSLKRTGFSAADWQQKVERIIATFPARRGADIPQARDPNERPIFIVGMPRSGTSLVEQILASHPAVYGAGELTVLAGLVDEIPARCPGAASWPEGAAALNARRLTRLGRDYLRALERRDSKAPRVTDKMWQNFEYLGLIERMLPGARVVHCRRDPLDTGLSCYFQHFIGQVGVPFSYKLEDIGGYYRGYRQLMKHWLSCCELPMLEVDYEQLVGTPEPVIRELLAFAGLPWDDACLAFHRTRRAVNTASVAQVKEPIYTRSVGRHRHYDQYLQPLREALEE